MEAFPFLNQILHTRRVDSSVMMWIQIRAKGIWEHAPPDFFIKIVQSCSSWVFQNMLLST